VNLKGSESQAPNRRLKEQTFEMKSFCNVHGLCVVTGGNTKNKVRLKISAIFFIKKLTLIARNCDSLQFYGMKKIVGDLKKYSLDRTN
jgi:hypothetical protein